MNATEKSRRRIYLMRHGDVSYFDAQGRPFPPDTVPLNEEGRHQAQAAARELAGVPFDRVAASDLVRSVETATILSAGRGLRLESFPELREVQPGRLADIPPEAIRQAFLGAFAGGVGPDTRFLGGETLGSLLDRVLGCFRNLLRDTSWQRLLIVAHGGVNRAVLTHALGTGLPGFAALEQDPGCMNILDVDDSGHCLVRLVNHTPYDGAKRGLEGTTMERYYREFCRRTSVPR